MRVIFSFVLTMLFIAVCYRLQAVFNRGLFHPAQWLLVIGMVIGSALASGRLRSWGKILRHLFANPPVPEPHECAEILATVRSSENAALMAGIIGTLLGMNHALHSINEPPELIADLVGRSLFPLIWGILISTFLLAPIGGRLARKFDAALAEAGVSCGEKKAPRPLL